MMKVAYALAMVALFGLITFPVSAQSVEKARQRAIAGQQNFGVPLDPLAAPPILTRAPISAPPHSMSAGGRVIGWRDLQPPHVLSETPFADLPPFLLDAMRTHVEWRTSSPRERENSAFIKRHEAALKLLSMHNVDVEGLMKKRRKIIRQNGRAGRGPNPEILGKFIRLPGYVVPLAFDETKVTEFLFVPVAGACVHTPTPPANQIVHVNYPQGLAFSSIFDAFWIEGELVAEDSKSNVVFYDGASNIEAHYSLNAKAVELYTAW
ncbi:DUF3299 domain-containing protein [Ruegeria sp. HKCCA4812]|uniref:DUF3299 domain-containing protein n=1 Tax=Ruegeria sp. HKCCA4812 TaxID=2682993 RepID=UPI0014897A96|nr:DUF3299 domain-containing protein [Ruegeria sp. HKCCA4812]